MMQHQRESTLDQGWVKEGSTGLKGPTNTATASRCFRGSECRTRIDTSPAHHRSPLLTHSCGERCQQWRKRCPVVASCLSCFPRRERSEAYGTAASPVQRCDSSEAPPTILLAPYSVQCRLKVSCPLLSTSRAAPRTPRPPERFPPAVQHLASPLARWRGASPPRWRNGTRHRTLCASRTPSSSAGDCRAEPSGTTANDHFDGGGHWRTAHFKTPSQKSRSKSVGWSQFFQEISII
jgi:hypothetical protein